MFVLPSGAHDVSTEDLMTPELEKDMEKLTPEILEGQFIFTWSFSGTHVLKNFLESPHQTNKCIYIVKLYKIDCCHRSLSVICKSSTITEETEEVYEEDEEDYWKLDDEYYIEYNEYVTQFQEIVDTTTIKEKTTTTTTPVTSIQGTLLLILVISVLLYFKTENVFV